MDRYTNGNVIRPGDENCFLFQGPVFPDPLKDQDDLKQLASPGDALPKLQYVFDAITLTRHKLEGKVPLLGFTGAPVSIEESIKYSH